MKKKGIVILISIFCCSGCYQVASDDDYRAVPTTNNPQVVPSKGYNAPFGFFDFGLKKKLYESLHDWA